MVKVRVGGDAVAVDDAVPPLCRAAAADGSIGEINPALEIDDAGVMELVTSQLTA